MRACVCVRACVWVCVCVCVFGSEDRHPSTSPFVYLLHGPCFSCLLKQHWDDNWLMKCAPCCHMAAVVDKIYIMRLSVVYFYDVCSFFVCFLTSIHLVLRS